MLLSSSASGSGTDIGARLIGWHLHILVFVININVCLFYDIWCYEQYINHGRSTLFKADKMNPMRHIILSRNSNETVIADIDCRQFKKHTNPKLSKGIMVGSHPVGEIWINTVAVVSSLHNEANYYHTKS